MLYVDMSVSKQTDCPRHGGRAGAEFINKSERQSVTDHNSNPAIGEPLMERPAALTLVPSALTTGADPAPALIDPASTPDVAQVLRLYDLGLAVVPAVRKDGKSVEGIIHGHHKWAKRLPRGKTEAFFRKHVGWTIALLPGLCCVPLVVVDCDDDPALEEAERRYGQSPIVIRTPRGVGGHCYYRAPASAVRQQNLRTDGWQIDIKAGKGAVVIIPPSIRPSSGLPYMFAKGSWADLRNLPVFPVSEQHAERKMHPERKTDAKRLALVAPPQAKGSVTVGERNDTLFRCALRLARQSSSLNQLVDKLSAENAVHCTPPLEPDEIEAIANSAWGYEVRGENWVGSGPRLIVHPEAELDPILDMSDAVAFHLSMRTRHEGLREAFAASPKAMAKAGVMPGWSHHRYRNCIHVLVERGLWTIVHQGGSKTGDPSTYAFAGNPRAACRRKTERLLARDPVDEMRAA